MQVVFELFTIPELKEKEVPDEVLYYYKSNGKVVAKASYTAGQQEDSDGTKYFVCLDVDEVYEAKQAGPYILFHRASGRVFFQYYFITNEVSFAEMHTTLWNSIPDLDVSMILDSCTAVWKTEQVHHAAQKLGLCGEGSLKMPSAPKPSPKYSWTLSSKGVEHAV